MRACVRACVRVCVCVCVMQSMRTYNCTCVHIPPTLLLQEQYIFIHDAILESVSCGDTQIVAGDLRDALEKLRMSTQTGQTGLASQFQVKQVIHWGVGWRVRGIRSQHLLIITVNS